MVSYKTPFRISFFGGGSDYQKWFLKNNGYSLGCSIDKYSYVHADFLYNYKKKSRFIFLINSKLEYSQTVSSISNKTLKKVLSYFFIKNKLTLYKKGLFLSSCSDLPQGSGMGSSSSFIITILKSLYGLFKLNVSTNILISEVINMEQNILKEVVGCQDQILTGFGGFNLIKFTRNNKFLITSFTSKKYRQVINDINQRLFLFDTNIIRYSSLISRKYIGELNNKVNRNKIKSYVIILKKAIDTLNLKNPLDRFGNLLHQAWLIKQSLNSQISNNYINSIYSKALTKGALGGKLLGAGGGGMLLLYVPKIYRRNVLTLLTKLLRRIPFQIEI